MSFRTGDTVVHRTHGLATVLEQQSSDIVILEFIDPRAPALVGGYRAYTWYCTLVERGKTCRYGPYKPIPKALPG